jgi:hypothetical protein
MPVALGPLKSNTCAFNEEALEKAISTDRLVQHPGEGREIVGSGASAWGTPEFHQYRLSSDDP